MKINQIKHVMKKYKTAWENQDSKLIVECFTKDAIYQESPLSKPYRGHKEIKNFWEDKVVNKTKDIHFTIIKSYIAGNIGFVEWKCKNYHKRDGKWIKDYMVGIMILKMKGNKISNLNEYWNTKHG